jgi:hypothetical protein
MDLSRDARRLVSRISKSIEAELILICGNVDEAATSTIIAQCEERAALSNVVLVLITLGGEPDAGYRLARYLQNKFERFSIFIPSMCKSAGTLVAIGAHEIIIGPFGELGPLDVQFYKLDELDEISSGLIAKAAISSLETTAIAMFERYFTKLQRKSGGLVTLRTATNIASDFVAKLLSPVYAQINPFSIGENDLAMRVAKDYAERLTSHSGNLKSPDALQLLVEGYPSHDFVIDRAEAETLFNNIRAADDDFLQLTRALDVERLMSSYDETNSISLLFTRDREAVRDVPGLQAPMTPAAEARQPRQFHKVARRKRRPSPSTVDQRRKS